MIVAVSTAIGPIAAITAMTARVAAVRIMSNDRSAVRHWVAHIMIAGMRVSQNWRVALVTGIHWCGSVAAMSAMSALNTTAERAVRIDQSGILYWMARMAGVGKTGASEARLCEMRGDLARADERTGGAKPVIEPRIESRLPAIWVGMTGAQNGS